MKTFEELKEELLIRAKNAGACQAGYAMGLRSNTKSDLLKAITENWFWVLRSAKIVDAKYLEDNFTEEELSEAGIYIRNTHEVRTVSFACGSATVKAYGSATVKACGSATVEAYDSATVEACDNSYVEDCTGNVRPQSDYAIVKDYHSHKIYIKKGNFEIIEV
ncbi:MAG TPA: hypothetical protein K8V61_10310 [Bacteroides clarus]|uniref:hypothetical protein n=1 Tax=Bacteroides clarus TaxID=626929 RepID=UPI001DA4AAC1|nr:hypothetical protein [Bacteroides clarus]HJF99667.1 hypothetical protein [Bacteroides clarus]